MKLININRQKLFIITDVHGSYRELEELLTKVPDDCLILFLGDYIDRGEDSLKTVRIVKELVESGRAIALKGNHEDMLETYLNDITFRHIFYQNGGIRTISDFLEMPAADVVRQTYKREREQLFAKCGPEIDFLLNLPMMATMESNLFVHAGINSDATTFQELDKDDLLWIRDDFLYEEHQLPYRVYVGHTPVRTIKGAAPSGVWTNATKTKVACDGGCVFGEHLNGLLLDPDKESLEVYRAYNKQGTITSTRVKDLSLVPKATV